MNELERACWFATWCCAAGYKRATRKWLVDALIIQWIHRECEADTSVESSLAA
ncbi:MAG: hypothetical protein KJO07_20130 [Deltaproteobacteria bacterium]|nr:hypothetical protein [Deltaproteobacteria bacterium]